MTACFFLETQIRNSSQEPKMTNYLRDTIKTWKIDSLNQFPLKVKLFRLYFFLSCGTSLGGIYLSISLSAINSSEKENIPNNSANIVQGKILAPDIKIMIKIVLYISRMTTKYFSAFTHDFIMSNHLHMILSSIVVPKHP